MASPLQPVCFAPESLSNSKNLLATGSAFKGTGIIEPYNPDEEQLRIQMQKNLELDLQKRINDYEIQKDKYEKRLDRFYHKQLEVVEKHQAINDRYFKVLTQATGSCLNARYLDSREKYAYELLTEPDNDLAFEEEQVNKLESLVEYLYEKLDNDINEETEKQLKQDEQECNNLIQLNSQRNCDIALRKLKVQQEKSMPKKVNPKYTKDTGIFKPNLPEQTPLHGSVNESLQAYSNSVQKMIELNQKIEEIDKLEEENRKNQKLSEKEYEEKIEKLTQLLDQVEEIEKYEAFVSEYEYANGKLKSDHYDNQNQIQQIEMDLLAQGYDISKIVNQEVIDKSIKRNNLIDDSEAVKQRIEEKQKQVAEKAERLQKRKENYENELNKVIEDNNKQKAKSEEIDQLLAQLNKTAEQTIEQEELANTLSASIHGEKTITLKSQDTISKIDEIKRNLEILAIDISDTEEGQ